MFSSYFFPSASMNLFNFDLQPSSEKKSIPVPSQGFCSFYNLLSSTQKSHSKLPSLSNTLLFGTPACSIFIGIFLPCCIQFPLNPSLSHQNFLRVICCFPLLNFNPLRSNLSPGPSPPMHSGSLTTQFLNSITFPSALLSIDLRFLSRNSSFAFHDIVQ